MIDYIIKNTADYQALNHQGLVTIKWSNHSI